MKYIVLIFALCSFSANANVAFNSSGKTLEQFFAMSSEILKKPIVLDAAIDGTIKIYGSHHSANFKSLFYSLLDAYGLSSFDNGYVIRIEKSKGSMKTDAESLRSYIRSTVVDVFISGSVGKFSNGKLVNYSYTFSTSDKRSFDPYSLGFTVDSFTPCLVRLSHGDYSVFLTCSPFGDEVKDSDDSDMPFDFEKMAKERDNIDDSDLVDAENDV
ncbi:TPA: hypothetical protein ACX6O5_001659 [Photobacterium damselae]